MGSHVIKHWRRHHKHKLSRALVSYPAAATEMAAKFDLVRAGRNVQAEIYSYMPLMPASHRFELICTIAYSSHQIEQFGCYLHLVIKWQYSDITSVFLRLNKGAWRSVFSGYRCAFLLVVWGAMPWISFAVFTFLQMKPKNYRMTSTYWNTLTAKFFLKLGSIETIRPFVLLKSDRKW